MSFLLLAWNMRLYCVYICIKYVSLNCKKKYSYLSSIFRSEKALSITDFLERALIIVSAENFVFRERHLSSLWTSWEKILPSLRALRNVAGKQYFPFSARAYGWYVYSLERKRRHRGRMELRGAGPDEAEWSRWWLPASYIPRLSLYIFVSLHGTDASCALINPSRSYSWLRFRKILLL